MIWLCRLSAFAVFENGRYLGIAIAVRPRFGKADLHIEIAVSVLQGR
jgi:hypothetical protein